jgi:DNA-binding NarL/FixJ family response regulator
MDKIRVLLGNHPLMVPNAIRQVLEEQQDMEVVGDCRGPMKILQEVGRTKADAVILAQEGSDEPGLCSQLLAVYPDLAILSVTAGIGEIFAQHLCSHRQKLVGVDKDNLAEALRRAVKVAGGTSRAE